MIIQFFPLPTRRNFLIKLNREKLIKINFSTNYANAEMGKSININY